MKSVTAVEGGFKSSDDNYTYIRGNEIIFIFKILIFIWNILIFLYSSNRRFLLIILIIITKYYNI